MSSFAASLLTTDNLKDLVLVTGLSAALASAPPVAAVVSPLYVVAVSISSLVARILIDHRVRATSTGNKVEDLKKHLNGYLIYDAALLGILTFSIPFPAASAAIVTSNIALLLADRVRLITRNGI